MLKVLLLNNRVPFPLKDGGAVASHRLIEGLIERKDVQLDLLFLNTKKHYLPDDEIKTIYSKANYVGHVDIDTSLRLTSALEALIKNQSYHVSRFYDRVFEELIAQKLRETTYDIIHLENLFLMPYVKTIKSFSNAKIILRMHNVEHRIWHQSSLKEKQPLRRIYLRILSKQLKSYEEHAVKSVDGLVPISEEDNSWLKNHQVESTLVLPTPVRIDEEISYQAGTRFFHIGSMEWKPNIDGCRRLVEDIWPQLKSQNPDAELHLAGRAMDEKFSHWNGNGVFVHGEVESAKEFMLQNQIMIIPIESASGLRIKAIEAMSLKRPIVSTPIGMSGTNALASEHFLKAESNQDFIEMMAKLATKQELQVRLSQNGFNFVKSNFGTANTSQKLVDYYNEKQKE